MKLENELSNGPHYIGGASTPCFYYPRPTGDVISVISAPSFTVSLCFQQRIKQLEVQYGKRPGAGNSQQSVTICNMQSQNRCVVEIKMKAEGCGPISAE